jgi:hypothetical protein
MTTPAHPPQTPKPPRTWRPMIGWTLGILAALGLAWFVGAVAVPVWRVRQSVPKALVRCQPVRTVGADGEGYVEFDFRAGRNTVAALGGPREAGRQVSLFLSLPDWLSGANPEQLRGLRLTAALVLPECGRYGLPGARRLLRSDDESVLTLMLMSLPAYGPEAGSLKPELERILRRTPDSSNVHRLAADALAKIRAEEPPK